MAQHKPKKARQTGPIAFMARNPVAANLAMLILMIGGLLGLTRVKQEVFPAFELDTVSITVPYPGASPDEIEQGIVLAVEEAVRAVDGVKRVTSLSSEGVGSVSVELLLDADPQQATADIKNEVDRITSFPDDAEEPTVKLLSTRSKVIELVIAAPGEAGDSRDGDLATLHQVAETTRAALLAKEGITQVEITGVPELEMAIEVPRERLDAYGMSLEQIAAQVALSSVELPGGELETRGGELLVKLDDRATGAQHFADIRLKGLGGAEVRLGDIADIRDGYADDDLAFYYQGSRAVQLTVYRVGDETPQTVSDATHEVLAEIEPTLPGELAFVVWDDDSEMLRGRIDLLVRNARMGLLLVLVVLALFLDLRLAFWVGMGIPITFLGTFFIMPGLDLSVNMVSLFAFIVTLGLVVDDAIVVGEAAFQRHEDGMPWAEAATAGASKMMVPITFAILTTVAAFGPLLFVPGFIGKIFGVIPLIVISVLVFSLVESFFILPAHLAHDGGFFNARIFRPINRARELVGGRLKAFIEGPFERQLRFVLEGRLIAVAAASALFIVTVGLVASGKVPFSFFPKLESDSVSVSARLPFGPAEQDVRRVRAELERSLNATIAEVGPELVEGQMTWLGQGGQSGGPGGGSTSQGAHLITVRAALVPSEERELSSQQFADMWKANTPEIPGVESLVFGSSAGPGAGAAVDLQISHPDEAVLAEVSDRFEEILRGYGDLSDVENTYASGKAQLSFSLLPEATQLGLSSSDVARQIRGAFYGAEALREQRGRNELKVMVRLPQDQRSSEYDLEAFKIRTPTGAFVPLGSVARFERTQAPTTITREDGMRIINVSAELAAGVRSNQAVMESLNDDVIPKMQAEYPALEVGFAGSQREQAEAFGSLGPNFLIALVIIYTLLAIPFRSYLQPLVIMAAIPFGFVGAIFGHLVMGYSLSVISFMGIIALTGVVINDSLVLMDAVNEYRRKGLPAFEAVVTAAQRRFRPILLTSLTTFFGLAPMILETSMQARFLIPMALSLGFGVLFATVIVLLIIPALYLLMEDALGWIGKSLQPEPLDDDEDEGQDPTPVEPVPAK
ncbi:MAG: efflux RND transporter permease subunit [Myxococcota bacterium]|nr:efflux RND transporter permease subunit [Myxococcota bacterium]